MTDKAWVQFLLVGVPVLSLIGAWGALRTVSRWRAQRPRSSATQKDLSGR
ncbi:MAG: hypothetical protein RL091_2651 [Verrucomicrobiota bacterium]|jgi:uncharacterized membrane protein YesL